MYAFLKNYSKETISILLIIGITLIVYYPVRFFDFVFIDDPFYVCNNQLIQNGLTWDGLKWAFFSIGGGSWHPLTWISHMIDISWYHMDSGGHHWTNVQIHLISTFLLFIFLRKSTQKIWISAAVTACFALHPLHVESVAWISERKDVLSVCMAHLTLLAYLWYVECPTHFRRSIVLFCFSMSLMSKPMMITLPFLLCILDYWPLGRWQKSITWQLIKEKIPLFILALAIAGFTYFSQKAADAMDPDLALKYRVLNAGIAYIQYLYKMFVPMNFSFLYPHPQENISVAWGGVCLGLTGGLFTVAIYYRKKLPYVFTGIVWYLFTLIPVIGIVQVGLQQMADRYTYFPMTGIAIAICYGIGHNKRRSLIPVALIVVLIGYAVVTRQQVHAWQNSYTLSKQALLNTSENNESAHYGLGEYYREKGDYAEAIKHYKNALNILPAHSRARFQLAFSLEKNQNHDDAIKHYNIIYNNNPELRKKVLLRLAHIYSIYKSQFKMAERHYRLALNLSPNSPLILTNYAILMIMQKKPEKALEYFLQAIIADPSFIKAYRVLTQFLLDEQEKSEDILVQCVNRLRQTKQAEICLTRLSQVFIVRKEYQLANFFKEKTHECIKNKANWN